MKTLSIVIVNYNVRHFLEQALKSVQAALKGIDAEVFVVDNNSVDGSVRMIQERFPWVQLIANKDNVGFSQANNQAIHQARGKYVLLLNPDTVVEEDTFHKTLAFMEATPDCGGLGVQMVNGQGKFLPESRRGLPTPWVAFYKVFGLSRLFPRSRRFGKYHLSYLSPHETHTCEVLSGAFMLLRKSVLDQIGLLDEAYFMYGEDIDLSYRILKAGYKNYYYAGTRIIHYKGESTKKGSLNYVLVFYHAMMIFARKHFSPQRISLFTILIQLAIYMRASLSILWRLWHQLWFPTVEFGLFLGNTLAIKRFWEITYRYTDGGHFPAAFDQIVAPGIALTFVGFLAVFGAYRRPYKIRPLATGVFFGFVAIATLSFIFRDYNYSRAIVVLSSFNAFVLSCLTRGLHNYLRSGSFFLDEKVHRRLAIVGDNTEARRVKRMLEEEIRYPGEITGLVLDRPTPSPERGILGNWEQLDEIIRFYGIEEVIFCNQSMSTQEIIEHMSRLARLDIDFRIAPPQADYIVGPNVILTNAGFQPRIANLCKPEYRLQKKLFDGAVSLGLLLMLPFTFWVYRRPLRALQNMWKVLRGSYHLVGYINGQNPDLPRLKYGVLDMRILFEKKSTQRPLEPVDTRRLDQLYANTYSPGLDWQILMTGFHKLDSQAG